MGTQVDIVVDGGDEPLLRHAVDHAYAEMARLEALFSRYQPDSVVSRISAAAGVQPVAVPSEVMAVLKTSQQLFRLSGGAFDVTVGSLKGWSFEAGRKTGRRALPISPGRAWPWIWGALPNCPSWKPACGCCASRA
jgi:thiamine biosynthesis lipoprotein